MCGIAGLLHLNGFLETNLIGAMTRSLHHRGPDDEGYLAVNVEEECMTPVALSGADTKTQTDLSLDQFSGKANLFLSHRRLSILDLSPAGHQPMRYGDDLWIVFNGEIYNYLELRKELRAEGYQFETATDTEIILAAYDRWGEECVTRFNGDWALCILDLKRRILFLSRDRYGIKPLYFFKGKKHFAFASEIKALLTLPFVEQVLNLDKALHYLFLFSLDHTEESFFKDVYQLKPAHNLVLDLQTGEAKIAHYYFLSHTPELGQYEHNKALDYAADIRDLLFDAVRLRLRADVPVGTCLSGGLDSSSVVAITAKLLDSESNRDIQKTFTATFPGNIVDESGFAQTVVQHTGAQSHLIYPSKERCRAGLSAILSSQDEPFGGTSIYAQWEVMREAARHVKVVLDGQGGDEVFAGYRDYRLSFLAHLLAEKRFVQLMAELWGGISVSGKFRHSIKELQLMPFFNLNSFLQYRLYRLRYRKQFHQAVRRLGHNGTTPRTIRMHLGKKYAANTNELLFHYLSSYSLPHLLKYEDRNSMAHSIEARVPFTDFRLVDYVFSIPAAYKIHRGWTKWLLRLAVKDLLPSEIVWRRDKLGFAAPAWISREEVWQMWLERTFPSTRTHRAY